MLTLREALDDLASGFELKKAVKMVNKYAALQRDLEPISFLLNQMFNKSRGAEIVE